MAIIGDTLSTLMFGGEAGPPHYTKAHYPVLPSNNLLPHNHHHHFLKKAFKITLDYNTSYIWLKGGNFGGNLKVYFFFPLLTRMC